MYVFSRTSETKSLPFEHSGNKSYTKSAVIASMIEKQDTYIHDKYVKESVRRMESYDADDCNEEFNTPEGLTLLPFQKVGVREIIKRRRMLLADDMGLGKTVQVLTTIYNLKPKNVVIVCPTFLRSNWVREAKKWCPDYTPVMIDGGSTKVIQRDKLMLICGYDILSRKNKVSEAFSKISCDFLVLDEAHMVKNFKAKRTRLLLGKSDNQLDGLASRSTYFVPCTGTPIIKDFEDMIPILLSTAPKTFSNARYFFIREIVIMTKSRRFVKKKMLVFKDVLRDLLVRSVLVRRTKEQVLKDLPDKIVQYLPYNHKRLNELSKEETDIITHIAEENGCSLEEAAERLSKTPGMRTPFRSLATIRKEQSLIKAEQACDIILNMLESIDKVIVFAYHRDCIDFLHSKLGGVKMYGGMSKEQKDKAVESFQFGNERVFIGQIDAAGTGLTLTASNYVVFVELDWSPQKLSQAEDRPYRIGQKNNVNVYYLLVEGSVDALIAKNMVPKVRLHQQLINGASE